MGRWKQLLIIAASAASLSFFGLIGLLERKILFWR